MIERFICSENVEKEGERDEIAPPSPRLLIAAIFCEAEVLSMKNQIFDTKVSKKPKTHFT